MLDAKVLDAKVLDAKVLITVSKESRDVLSHCSDNTPREVSDFLPGELVLLVFTAKIDLQTASLCRNETSFLCSLGVSHQVTAVGHCAAFVFLLSNPIQVLSLGVADSRRFSLGVSFDSTKDKESSLVILCGVLKEPEYPLSKQSSQQAGSFSLLKKILDSGVNCISSCL